MSVADFPAQPPHVWSCMRPSFKQKKSFINTYVKTEPWMLCLGNKLRGQKYGLTSLSFVSVISSYGFRSVSMLGDWSECFFFADSLDDQVKIAKILFVYAILFGIDGRTKSIEKWLWVLIEDENRWTNFPWGAYSSISL
ncbi:hypothetical protein PHJA_001441700 [Phtheirospermum japonicum]|uniref:DUF1985 domain-containing protein n=1 Tax=Phtheirospermum japonicum TaxID=374723 RepID=A0A830C993_9LAMI|nr:hypothetical protein PHJA_001441700 [Phtheirospermum japonicum]